MAVVAARNRARTGTRAKAAAPGTGASVNAKSATLIFHVALQGRRSIWRDVELRSNATLYKLAEVTVRAFGFDFDHAFGFYPPSGNFHDRMPRYELFTDIGEPTGEGVPGVKQTKAASAFQTIATRMTMLFDYGDEWLFDVELKAIGQVEPRARYPRLLAGSGKAPPQYPPLDEGY